jgi:hypothetical protein
MASQQEPLSQVVAALRRVVGLHGDAVGNAARSVRVNERARRHRTQIEREIRALDGVANPDPTSDPKPYSMR